MDDLIATPHPDVRVEEKMEPFTGPFTIEPGEFPEPDTILDANNKPVPIEWLCASLNREAELRAALEEIANDHQKGGYRDAYLAVLRIARAALEAKP